MGGDQIPAEAIVRIRDAAGGVVGSGFLATSDLVLTCAHVLGDERPDADITIDFPLLPGDTRVVAQIVAWHGIQPDDRGDIAVLRLTTAPSTAVPSRLSITQPPWGEQVRVFGFPPDLGSDHGIWIEAELRGTNGAGWLQIESAPGRRLIGRGFSGSPVFAPSLQGVVGIVVAAERGNQTTTSFMLPVSALIAAHPEIVGPDPRELCPYRGLEPFYEEHADQFRGRESLTDRLLELAGSRSVIVVAGPSGSGKSSVVRAGLVPAVRRRGMDTAVFRVLSGEPALTSLARALVPMLEPGLGEAAQLAEAESLAARLSTARARTLPWLADRLLARTGPGGLLIVVDQFEESAADRPGEARELFELLIDLGDTARRQRDGSPALVVVVTLRSGALDELVTDRTTEFVAGGVVFVPPMTRAQLARAIHPVGVTFESGLVERILDDAGTEPGTLPLLEFALARLWDKRSAGTLTHSAYDELGGVAGALAGYAEQLYERLTIAEKRAARRVLMGLARPDQDGGFLRRPALVSDVDDELLPVLGKLSAGRLVVVGKSIDGTEIIELAHEALLRHWPRLDQWLTEQRDYLSWREQLRSDVARWQADQGALLDGAALARAEEWLATGRPDLSTEERKYVRTSQARKRRRVRILWGALGLISGLLVVSGGLGLLAARANQEAQAQLRIARSRALAEDSMRFRTIDPRMALQLAQAAWHIAPTDEAYGALFSQYVGLRSVDKVFQDVWTGALRRVMSNPDGSVAVFVNDSGLPTAWAGLDGDNPHGGIAGATPQELTGGTFQLSPSGKLLGYANATGAVALWNLEDHSPAVILSDAVRPTRSIGSMAFSPDETRLLIKRQGFGPGNPEFELWDLISRTTVPIAERLGPQDINTNSAYFGPKPNTMVLDMIGGGANIYDLATGQLVRAIPEAQSLDGRLAQNGALLVHCLSSEGGYNDTLQVLDIATGTMQRTIPVPNCSGMELDSSTNYALAPQFNPGDTGSDGELLIIDVRTGAAYQTTTPPMKLSNEISAADRYNDKIALFTGADGRPTALIGNKNLLVRQRPAAFVPRNDTAGRSQLTDPDGNLGITFDPTGAIKLNDLKSGATTATTSGGDLCFNPCAHGRPIDFSSDGKRLLVVRDDTMTIYSVPTLSVEARIDLPLPRDIGGPPIEDGGQYPQWGSDLGTLDSTQAMVLHAGMITRWNLADYRQIGTPTQVRPDRDGLRRAGHLALLEPRPDHPAEAVVIQPSGVIQLWNLDQHQIIANLGVADATTRGSVRFTSDDGKLAAVRDPGGNIQIWRVDPAQKQGRPIPAGGHLLGPTPDGQLIVIKDDALAALAQIWSQHSGKLLATLTWPSIDPNWSLENYRLRLSGEPEIHSIDLDPRHWFETLCQLSNREFTDDEHTVLAQLDAPDERPCG